MVNRLALEPAEEPRNAESSEEVNKRIREVVYSLFQMEKEISGLGLKFSALMLRAAALSFSCDYKGVEDDQ